MIFISKKVIIDICYRLDISATLTLQFLKLQKHKPIYVTNLRDLQLLSLCLQSKKQK